ncbi:hypothetical protein EDD15DRAFT_2216336 [Pisolithus albus]|nr:hypothetical protein EDD15DRAFT_2216336 [Pisolithus albus]
MQPCFSVLLESTIPSILALVLLTCTATTTTTTIIQTKPRNAQISHDSTCPCIGMEREQYRFGRVHRRCCTIRPRISRFRRPHVDPRFLFAFLC